MGLGAQSLDYTHHNSVHGMVLGWSGNLSIPTTLGPEGVQYTEKFSILKVLLNSFYILVKVLQVQLVHA